MAAETVLVVDDEPNIVDLAKLYLEQDGFNVIVATDGEQALALIADESPDLVVLDLMLPKIDGWDVCRQVRAESDLPILMLTARDDDVDKIVGLELGADDYLTKPFNPRELVARIKAILRRASPKPRSASRTLQIGDVTIDAGAYEVTVGGQMISLRAKEFDLLLALAEHQGQVLSREQLLDLVWGFDFYGQTRTVDVHVANLRSKLDSGAVSIETVWGVGYKLTSVSQSN